MLNLFIFEEKEKESEKEGGKESERERQRERGTSNERATTKRNPDCYIG